MATKSKLSPLQRAATVVIALSADRASEVYKYLKEDEVEQLSLEIAKLDRLTPEEMQETIEDFYGLCVTQKVINEGGVLYAKDVLEKAFGSQQASLYGVARPVAAHQILRVYPQGGLQKPADDAAE